MNPLEVFEQEKKDYYYNDLYNKGIEFVRNGKLYGYDIDINNPRDVIAALFCAYQMKELMVDSQERLNSVQVHKR